MNTTLLAVLSLVISGFISPIFLILFKRSINSQNDTVNRLTHLEHSTIRTNLLLRLLVSKLGFDESIVADLKEE